MNQHCLSSLCHKWYNFLYVSQSLACPYHLLADLYCQTNHVCGTYIFKIVMSERLSQYFLCILILFLKVKLWILPETEQAMAQEEARHLVSSADEDKDGKLSEDEMINNHEIFVGSEATDYGRALPKHEEL